MTIASPFHYQLDGDGPLFRQINRAIAQPILSGLTPPGTRLPSEHAFMDVFGASRMTVNRALQMLSDDGLVTRHRRNGTFVAPQVAEHSVMELRDIVDEVTAQGCVYGYQLLEYKRLNADAVQAEKLDVRVGAPLLYVLCRHDSDNNPLLIEERYINSEAVPACLDQSFETSSPGHWLLENVPWSGAEHIITAVNASEAQSHHLNIPRSHACLCVERTTWQDGERITFVTLTYPGDKHRLVGNFQPGQ